MTPETFKDLGKAVQDGVMRPIGERLQRAKTEAADLERRLIKHQRFVSWHRYLTNGETMAGMFGCAPHFAFFVRHYRAEEARRKGQEAKLLEADLVIIPDLLVPHDLRVNVPHASNPKVSTNTSMPVDVPGIVARMMEHAKQAANVKLGTLDDVLREPCAFCGQPALIAGLDEYLDDDNGRAFVAGRFCTACSLVEEIASYCEYHENSQYALTDGMYRPT